MQEYQLAQLSLQNNPSTAPVLSSRKHHRKVCIRPQVNASLQTPNAYSIEQYNPLCSAHYY
ncbi:hypothetical protein LguiA_033641 [Lonicera macranthoides]